MTSLPISIPHGYSILVKKGDKVKAGQILAKTTADSIPTEQPLSSNDQVINFSEALAVAPDAARKYVQKGPGDVVSKGEVLAEKSSAFGLKKEKIFSNISGTIVRFERDTGKLLIRTEAASAQLPRTQNDLHEIVSPLDGTISVCNNDAITIETESKTLVGSNGVGGNVHGHVVALSPKGDAKAIQSDSITKDVVDKIILLPDIEKEAVAKAAALGVLGILGTELSEDLFAYISARKINIPLIAIDPAIGKKIVKEKGEILIDGDKKSIIINE